MYTHLLTAIRGLTDKVNNLDTQPQQTEDCYAAEPSPGHLPSDQEQDGDQEQRHPDAISLYAQESLVGNEGNPEWTRPSEVSSLRGDSTSGGEGTDDADTMDLVEGPFGGKDCRAHNSGAEH